MTLQRDKNLKKNKKLEGELYIVGEQHGTVREDDLDSRAGARSIGVGKPQYIEETSDLNQPKTEESDTVDSISGGEASGSADDLSDYDTITDSNTITSPSIISGAYMTKGVTPKNADEQLNEDLETDTIDDVLPGKGMTVELFHIQSCSSCKKVRDFIESNGLKNFIEYHDIEDDSELKAQLGEINNGNTQVPCLVVDGEPITESEQIIDWLKSAYQMEMSS